MRFIVVANDSFFDVAIDRLIDVAESDLSVRQTVDSLNGVCDHCCTGQCLSFPSIIMI